MGDLFSIMNSLSEKLVKEAEELDYFEVETDPVIDELVNRFIKQALPDSYPHYVDNDENAAQLLRVQLSYVFSHAISEAQAEERKRTLKEVKDFSFDLVEDCHPDCTHEEHQYHQGTWVSYRKLDEWCDEGLASLEPQEGKEECFCICHLKIGEYGHVNKLSCSHCKKEDKA